MKNISMAEIRLTEDEIAAALQVLRSGALRQGSQCESFERQFSDTTGARYSVTCANGSAALHLAFLSFLAPGDEVLVPSFTFIATGSMVSVCGGRPVFCDVDPESYLIDLKDAENRLTERTRAIVPVHLFGNPCEIEQIQDFAKKHKLIVVWDGAQAHGAKYTGTDVGSFQDFVCYSFYPSKNMFVGEGGMVCTESDEFVHKLRFLRSHGQTGKYYHTMLGLNYRMTDVEAAIGVQQLTRLDEMLALRKRNAQILSQGLQNVVGITPQKITAQGEHAWHQYCVRVSPETFGCDRDQLAARLAEKNIATGVHYPRGLHQQPIFKELYGKCSLPATEKLCQMILALPVHHGLLLEDVERIVAEVVAIQASL